MPHNHNVLTVLALSLLLMAGLGCQSKPAPPPRPDVVPTQAVWVAAPDEGGSFLQCDTDTKHNVNRCLAYNEFTGDVEAGGFYQLEGLARAATPDELHIRSFDGTRIGLTNGTLAPVPPIRPEGVPPTTTFANGLFFSCGGVHAGAIDCVIYRPDGHVYYAGSFAYRNLGGDATPTATAIKYFHLSDRTIHLEDGDKLVAK